MRQRSRVLVWLMAVGCFDAGTAYSQSGVYAYLPEKNAFLKLRSATVESTVMGPIVRTCTDFVYDPLPPGAGEAGFAGDVSFNFELPETSALGGFGYFTGDRFVPARLEARGISPLVNASIGNGLRESGLVNESAASVYRCEIVPEQMGSSNLRIRVWTVGMVQLDGERVLAPRPSVETPIVAGTSGWSAREVEGGRLGISNGGYTLGAAQTMRAVAQKFSDGRFYVAGYLHSRRAKAPSVEIESANYEPVGGGRGSDVTALVTSMVRRGQFFVWASDSLFGDPKMNALKRLRVVATIDGVKKTLTVSENETMNLLDSESMPEIRGLNEVKTVFMDAGTVAFSGWTTRPTTVGAHFQGHEYMTEPSRIAMGSDAARLWSQQMLATNAVKGPDQVLEFSLKYGILSDLTAMVAITKQESKVVLPPVGIDVGRSR